jgi:hypothetical protein
MIDPEDIARNRASRERLATIVRRLGDRDLALDDDWTAGAVLAHLAFWDRVAAARIGKYLRAGKAMEFFDEVFFEYINDSALPQWRQLAVRAAAADALESAAATDGILEHLSAEDVARLRALERPGLFQRFPHRTGHLDQLERALR